MLDEITQVVSLEATLRLDEVGIWKLVMHGQYASQLDLALTNGVEVWRDNNRIIDGPIMDVHKQLKKGQNIYEVSGGSNLKFLSDCLCNPESRGISYDSARGHYYFTPKDPEEITHRGYDIATGSAETVMKHLVKINAADEALTKRRIPNLTVAPSKGRGGTVTSSARLDVLLTQIQNLGRAGGDLHFDITRQDKKLVFDCFTGGDYTSGSAKQVIFSPENGTLREYDIRISASTGNAILIGGPGEGWDRCFGEVEDSESIANYGRVEYFADARHIKSTTATDAVPTAEEVQAIEDGIVQTGNEEVTSRADQVAINVVLEENDMLQYLRDFKLGDQVSVMVDNVPHDDTIRELYYLYSSSPSMTSSSLQTMMRAKKSLRMIMQKLKNHDAKLQRLSTSTEIPES